MTELALIQIELKDTELLVFQRRDEFAPTSPNLLGYFGGHVDLDDMSVEAAAYRELNEETSLGFHTIPLTFIASIEIPQHPELPKDTKLLAHVYKCVVTDADFSVNEGKQAETYTKVSALKRDDISYTARYVLEHS